MILNAHAFDVLMFCCQDTSYITNGNTNGRFRLVFLFKEKILSIPPTKRMALDCMY